MYVVKLHVLILTKFSTSLLTVRSTESKMSDDKPFKMIPELQAGALNAWTPLQQAALYRQHAVLQADMDDKAEARKKRKDEADAVKRKVKPERVEAGEVMDQLVCFGADPPCTRTSYGEELMSILDGRPHDAVVRLFEPLRPAAPSHRTFCPLPPGLVVHRPVVHALLAHLPHDVHRPLRLHPSSTVPIKAQRALVGLPSKPSHPS